MATQPVAWRYRSIARTGWPDANRLWEREVSLHLKIVVWQKMSTDKFDPHVARTLSDTPPPPPPQKKKNNKTKNNNKKTQNNNNNNNNKTNKNKNKNKQNNPNTPPPKKKKVPSKYSRKWCKRLH